MLVVTPLRRLADLCMGGTLDSFVAERRAVNASWRSIARGIRERTNGEIDVTGEAVRQWYVDDLPSPEKASA